MRAIRTKEGKARNPVFSVSEKRRLTTSGQPYDVPEFITLPVGQEIDCPDAWRLCVKGVAVAADDECRKKFFDYVGEPGRKAIVEQIFLLRTASATTRLSETEQRHLNALEKAYAVDLKIAENGSGPESIRESLGVQNIARGGAGSSGNRQGDQSPDASGTPKNASGSDSDDDGTNDG